MTPLERLELPTDSTVGDVKTRWRELASKYHPDRGGDPNLFSAYRQAYLNALDYVSKPKKCGRCHGSGKLAKSHGFNTIFIRCPDCNGKGIT